VPVPPLGEELLSGPCSWEPGPWCCCLAAVPCPSAPLFPKLGQGTAARQQHQGPGSQEHGPDRSSSPKGGTGTGTGTGTGRQARDEITRKAEPCLLVGKGTDSSRQADRQAGRLGDPRAE